MVRSIAAPLLAHVNLLLTLFGGALLATAARLKWDPSTYLAVRELFPGEYAPLSVWCCVAGLSLLLLPHLAVTAQHVASTRAASVLLYIYAGSMALLVVGEIAFGAWFLQRLVTWLASDAALQLREALELRKYLKIVLQYFSRWYPLPKRIEDLIKEAEEDAPRNLYVAGVAGLVLATLQLLSVVLALSAARTRTYTRLTSHVLAKHDLSGRVLWRGDVFARCVTFVINIYYRPAARRSLLHVA